MKIVSEMDLEDFEFWSGAKDRADKLDSSQFRQIERVLEEQYPDGMTDTEINDLFWFDFETVLGWINHYECGICSDITSDDGMVWSCNECGQNLCGDCMEYNDEDEEYYCKECHEKLGKEEKDDAEND